MQFRHYFHFMFFIICAVIAIFFLLIDAGLTKILIAAGSSVFNAVGAFRK